MAERAIEIIIPLAGAGASDGGAICHVQAVSKPHEAADKAGFHPTIAALKAMGLHKAGQRALDRVNTLSIPRKGRLFPRLTGVRARSSRLIPLNVEAVRSLGADNARSAELGLALGLLALERNAPSRLIVATGALADIAVGSVSAYDTPVLPVTGLAQKFSAIATWLTNHRPAPGSQNLDILVPETTPEGTAVLQAHAAEIAALQAQLSPLGIHATVRPVSSLAEAAERLGALHPPLGWGEVAARSGVGLVAATAVVGLLSLLPLRPEPAPLDYFLTGPLETPLVQRFVDGAQLPVTSCYGADTVLQLQENDILTVRYTTDQTLWPAWTYQVMFVLIGERSSAKLFTGDALHPDDVPQKTQDNRLEFGFAIDVGDLQEDMMLVALGRRLYPFGTRSLFTALGEAQQAKPDNALNAQAAALEQIYGTFTWHNFRVVGNNAECIARAS